MSEREIKNLQQIVQLFSKLDEHAQECVCAYAAGLVVGKLVERMDIGLSVDC